VGWLLLSPQTTTAGADAKQRDQLALGVGVALDGALGQRRPGIPGEILREKLYDYSR
jgi:hypothetical protein